MTPRTNPRPRGRRRFVVVGVIATLAVIGGAVEPWAYATFVDTSAKDRIEADPPPALFPDNDVAPIGAKIDDQRRQAEKLMKDWWSSHGATPDDAAFEAWLQRTLPAPPSAAERKKEIEQVQQIAPTRTDAGVTAATWLEAYGKKDVWKLAAHDQAEYVSASTGDDRKSAIDDILSMTKTVADDLGAKFQMSAPYVLEPSLRTDHVVTPGDVCPCSYPSRHASAAAASRTFLAHFMSQRDQEYRWWQDQIDYSRIYMAGHVASDIAGGTLLGDMVGEYFLVTRGHVDPGRL